MAPLMSCGLLALLVRQAFATISSTSIELCTTKYGITSKSPVPSTTHALILTFYPTLKSTSTPIVTVTPATTTQTLTYTRTTTTVTATTLPQSTSTILTPSGFTYPPPLPSAPPLPSSSSEKRAAVDSSPPDRRNLSPALGARANSNPSGISSCHVGTSGTSTYSPDRHPTSVICDEVIEIFSTSTIIITASTTLTVTAPQSTIKASKTTTKTITEIATVTPPAATFYAACAPSNLLTLPPGWFIEGYAFSPGTVESDANLTNITQYECCVACITTPYCQIARYATLNFEPPADQSYTCALDFGSSETTCEESEMIDAFIWPNDGSTAQFNINTTGVSLGYCGAQMSWEYDPCATGEC